MTENNETVFQNTEKFRIDNTTYIVKSFISKSNEKKVLSSISRLIKNELKHTQ